MIKPQFSAVHFATFGKMRTAGTLGTLAAIAFTAGYFIVQRWLEHYAIRTSIPAWVCLSIILVMALVIVLCVGWQVYKSSVENPAEVIKK